MTATTGPPTKEGRRRRRIRFSSMETLGFSNPSSIWSDHTPPDVARRGKHEKVAPEPDTLADWQPQAMENRLNGRDFRWSIILSSILVIIGLAAAAYWIYQRTDTTSAQAVDAVHEEAINLREALPSLEKFNAALPGDETGLDADAALVDKAARGLFEAAGGLADTESGLRSAAGTAASSALDALRLVTEADSYRVAVAPILVTPALETDPQLVQLDDAVRGFGNWQLHFDEVRTALPDGVLSDTTEQLDILSGDLSGFLASYMDALRGDDGRKAQRTLEELNRRLEGIHEQMVSSVAAVQTRVSNQIDETRRALDRMLG